MALLPAPPSGARPVPTAPCEQAFVAMSHTTDPMTTSRAARGWSLVAHGDGEVLPLRNFPCRIGRQPGLLIRLVHTTVSLLHAELRLSGEELTLTDLNSRNGTFINGRRLKEVIRSCWATCCSLEPWSFA